MIGDYAASMVAGGAPSFLLVRDDFPSLPFPFDDFAVLTEAGGAAINGFTPQLLQFRLDDFGLSGGSSLSSDDIPSTDELNSFRASDAAVGTNFLIFPRAGGQERFGWQLTSFTAIPDPSIVIANVERHRVYENRRAQ